MLKGKCLCGNVRYEYDGDITEIAMCHCSQCRQAQGGAFATNSPVESRKLSFTGTEYINEFKTSENKVRAFCKNCGSPLYSARKDLPNIKRLRLGTVETPFSCENRYHIYADSKAHWHSIIDDYPQYAEGKSVTSRLNNLDALEVADKKCNAITVRQLRDEHLSKYE